MRLVDLGKVAATVVDSRDGRAFRIRPRTSARELAQAAAPDAQSRWHAYLEAYQIMPDDELLEALPVRLTLDLAALISRNGVRAQCDACGEEIINEREVARDGHTLCRSCADGAYYRLDAPADCAG
jgi:formylmethanofuran dehydrogenase subunit E